ncbi:MAG TPA: MFS transporter [Actinomycetota bacterium]|nr:MFS transporter [Actinomycetota bacterium]
MSEKLVTPPTTPPPQGTHSEPALMRIGMIRPLRHRDFRYMWVGLTVSLFGDGLYLVAIAWQTYQIRNTASALGIVLTAWSLPMVLALPFGGMVSDRFDRRKVLIASDVIRGVAITIMGVLSLSGIIEIWHLVILAGFYGIGQAFFGPAFGAIVPDLVPQDELVQANALDNFVRPMAERFIGPAVGGLIAEFWSPGGAFVLDGFTFAVSALMIMRMTHRPGARRADGSTAWSEVKEGFAFVRSKTWLWATLACASVSLLFVFGPFELLVPLLIKNRLGGGADDVGYVFAASGAGALLAAFLMGQYGMPKRHIVFLYVGLALGIFLMWPYAFVTATWQAAVIEFFAWGAWSASLVVWTTLMHRLVPRELLGRVTSLDWMVSISLTPISYALTGPISDSIGLDATFIWSGVLGGGLCIAFLFVPGVRASERDGSIHPPTVLS